MRGRFISIEGGEGAGKSTQLAMLKDALEKAGVPAIFTREPGGTPGAEAIRELIVTGEPGRWDAITETLLIMAARRDHVQRVVKPALAEGKWVISDRYLDSTIVYQGISKGLGIDWIMQLYRLIEGDFAPDLAFYLDIDPKIGLERTQNRENNKETRFEAMDVAFHERLRAGFSHLCATYPQRMMKLDATQPQQTLHEAISHHLINNFKLLV